MAEEIKDDFTKDADNEKIFLSEVSKCKNVYTLERELNIMIKLYNEQLNNLVGLRFDLDLLNGLTIAEPNTKQYEEEKLKADKTLKVKRKLFKIMREQILRMMTLLGEKKNG